MQGAASHKGPEPNALPRTLDLSLLHIPDPSASSSTLLGGTLWGTLRPTSHLPAASHSSMAGLFLTHTFAARQQLRAGSADGVNLCHLLPAVTPEAPELI